MVGAEQLHSVNIRAIVQLARQNPMALAVAREEDHLEIADASGDERIRRRAERSAQLNLLHIVEAGHLIEAAAPDYA